MTVQFRAQWNGYEQYQIVTLASAEETRLIAAGICRAWTDSTEDRSPVMVSYDPDTGAQQAGPYSVSGAWKTQMSAAYRASLLSGNARTRAQLTLAAAAFGSTPSAGTVGYANSGNATPPNVSGKRFWDFSSAPLINTQNWGPMRAEGGVAYDAGLSRQGLAYYSGGTTRVGATWRVRFITNDPEPVLYVVGGGTPQQTPLIIDGQRCSTNLIAHTAGGRQPLSINLRGLGPGYHTIELIFAQDMVLGGLYIDPRYQVQTPAARPVIAMFTDSLGTTIANYGANPSPALDAYPQFLADYLGADVRLFAAGSTGYVATGSSETFAARVPLAATQLAAAGVSPALVVFAGGVNDSAQTVAAIQSGAAAALAAAAAAWPSASRLVLGSWAQNNAGNQALATAGETAIFAAAAAAANVPTVPVMTDALGAWITGSGNTSAPTGTGVADLIFDSGDTVHWNTAGHAQIGHKVAHAVALALGL